MVKLLSMKKAPFLVFIFVSFVFWAALSNAEVIKKETQGFKYCLFVPATYDASRNWPLIITFHPSTGSGSFMVERISEQAEKKCYIVAGPDSKDTRYWNFSEAKDVFRMLEEIKKDYRIDEKNIFLTGFSSGALMTYYMGLNYPEKFCGLAPFSGYLKRLEEENNVFLSREITKHIPVLIVHGKNDNVVNIGEAIYASERLKQFGYDVFLRELGGLDHEYPSYVSWIIINWFEKISRKND
jgi:predicted esterase